MKRRLITIFSAVIIGVSAFSHDFKSGKGYYNINSDGKSVTVTYKEGAECTYEGDVVIPSEVSYKSKTYSVTAIGSSAFSDGIRIKSARIPNTVKTIGSCAFSGCDRLSSITLPNSVIKIEPDAFSGCVSIETLEIDNNNFANTSVFGDSKTRIKTLKLGNSVSEIAAFAFSGCDHLMSVSIPSSVGRIGESAFSNCTKLKKVEITDMVKWCGITFANAESNPLFYAHHLFVGESEVTNLELPASVAMINPHAFEGCSGFSSVTIPNTLKTIGSDAFRGCSNINSLNIDSETCATMEHFADARAKLVSLVLGKNVTEIGKKAFSGCPLLTSVTIPNTVTEFGESAFSDCVGLKKVIITDLESWCDIIFSNAEANPLTYAHHLFVGDEEITDVVIPSSISSIWSHVFSSCSGLTSITIPSSVKKIDNDAFEGCTNIKTLKIDNNAFASAAIFPDAKKSIDTVVLEKSVTSIPAEAFAGCIGLTAVTMPNTLTSIGDSAFSGCAALSSLQISRALSVIGDKAFFGCGKINAVSIPQSVEAIGTDAFKGCSGIKSLNINNNKYASIIYFNDSRTKIEELVLDRAVSEIQKNAFYGCSGLKRVNISESVTEIGMNAFYGCSKLETLVVPNSVTTIEESAFYDCSRLTSLTIGESVKKIGKNAFSGCESLVSITNLSEDPQEIYDYDNVFELVDFGKCNLECPSQSESKYKTSPVWKDFYGGSGNRPRGRHSSSVQRSSTRTGRHDNLYAEETEGKTGIGGNISATPFFVSSESGSTFMGISAKLQRNFSRVVRGELKIGYDWCSESSFVNASINFHFKMGQRRVSFYPILGFGGLMTFIGEDIGGSSFKAIINGGLGLDIKILRKLTMSVEACYQHILTEGRLWRLPVSAGLTYRFR